MTLCNFGFFRHTYCEIAFILPTILPKDEKYNNISYINALENVPKMLRIVTIIFIIEFFGLEVFHLMRTIFGDLVSHYPRIKSNLAWRVVLLTAKNLGFIDKRGLRRDDLKLFDFGAKNGLQFTASQFPCIFG